MSNIKTKRASLEAYLREQVIGPGAGRNRVVRTNNETEFTFLNQNYSDNSEEALTVVPGIYYSSGILFPNKGKKKAEANTVEETDNNTVEGVIENPIEDTDDNNILEERNLSDDDDETQMDQMYPKTMGFTFCMKEDDLTKEGFEILLTGRHYKRVNNDDVKNFGIRIELPKDEFIKVLNTKLGDFGTLGIYFKIEEIGSFSFAKQFSNYPVINLVDSNGNPILNSQGKQKQRIENILNLASSELGNHFYQDNLNLFTEGFSQENVKTVDSLLKHLCNQLLKFCKDSNQRKILYEASQQLEKYQNILSHLADAHETFTGRYGVWESKTLKKKINVKKLELGKSIKKIFSGDKLHQADFIDEEGNSFSTLKDLIKVDLNDAQKAALSINLQLSKDTRGNNDLIYCKIQVLNTSSDFIETDKKYFSMATEGVNERCFFGVECKVVSKKLEAYNDRNTDTAIDDKEGAAIRFLYREMKDFGIGHGCSVSWGNGFVKTNYMPYCDTPDVDPTPRDTSQTPINGSAPEFLKNTKIQQIKFLSTLSDARDEEIIKGLKEFIEAYGTWISQKQKFVDKENLNQKEKEIAKNELAKCSGDYQRLKYNVETYLLKGSDNLKKFRLMNTSMFIQMWHGKYSDKKFKQEIKSLMDDDQFSGFNAKFYKDKCKDDIFQKGVSAGWRAFQLAFILLNLDGIFDDNSENEKRNELVDLVWFPTGGGKTEAYLGLISLTIIHRKMKYGATGGGTAAIMRYTLRLLTLQQFQRASKLIIALELMRRGHESFGQDLGVEPIRIGLYVGDNQIPNKTKDTRNQGKGLIDEFKKLNDKIPSKIPFEKCVCCGSPIKGLEKILNDQNNNFNHDIGRLECTNIKCAMRTPLGPQVKQRPDMGFFPFLLSDEAIYQHPPALLFGTVDKFAQLAHRIDNSNEGRKKDSRRIFGRGNWESYKPNNGYLPPDLIIQDELHLLLGPLGTGVALFESAFEQLCTREDGTKPKVISSTATTRNTGLQIEALFNKNLSIFPKPGIDCDDSFFGMYKRDYKHEYPKGYNYASNRRYIGILPTGRTQVWMQMRIDALCLAHRALFELEYHKDDTITPNFTDELEKTQDYYHSVVSYFNSVKEVGRTQSQVQTYILKETRKVLNRSMRSQKLLKPIYAMKDKLVEAELTGRLSGEEVKKELERVESNWSPNRFPIEELDKEGKIWVKQQYNTVPEFVVATNMISVGLDVSRFNTIVMNSMPRNTAEYIQASSRVARNDLGLVITVHHPFRARDLSHYEKFIEFHEKMYSYVEPISITPFTKKAVDKFMPLYVATIVRHFFEEFANRNTANNITQTDVDNIVQRCISYFENRQTRLANHTEKAIRELLSETDLNYIKEWIIIAIRSWLNGKNISNIDNLELVFKNANFGKAEAEADLYSPLNNLNIKEYQKKWQVAMSLRNIEPTALIHINQF
ncbi:helicase-related protein [Flavobacterium sp.]|uniref:helicase-related protein n=1 Tax=Flavobacterium sp. TaxID=239 RepID=UPI003D2E9CE7